LNTLATIDSAVRCIHCGYNLLGLSVMGHCPECGAATSSTLPACPRCSKPGDALALTPTDRQGVWNCGFCKGIGFDVGQLRFSLASQQLPMTHLHRGPIDLTAQLPIQCTRCLKPAAQISIDGSVIFDRCLSCGMIWIDDGELPAVVGYVARLTGSGVLPANLEALLHDPEELKKQVVKFRQNRRVAASVVELLVYVIAGLFGA
jgi:Zn-finger nucleic acid-binding protein